MPSALPLVLLAAFWVFNSVYQVQPDERGIVLRFGEYNRTADPGLHFAVWPVETMEKPRVGAVRQINIGMEANEGPDAHQRQEHHFGSVLGSLAHP